MPDLFTPDTGLKENFDGTITEAEWVQSDLGGGYGLALTIDADDGELAFVRLGVGRDWISVDGGETLVNERNSNARFNERTTYWRWIAAAMRAGGKDELQKMSNERYGGNGPCVAEFWRGWRFHFDVVNEPGRRPDEQGNWRNVEGGIPALRPVKFIGRVDSHQPNLTAADTATATSTPTAPTNGAGAISDVDMINLKVLAKTHDDYGRFADAVMEATAESGEPFFKVREVMTAIASQDFYDTLRAAQAGV